MNEAAEPRTCRTRPKVLALSDDLEFARSVATRWQTERTAPEITLATSDGWQPDGAADQDLIILGPINAAARLAIHSALSGLVNKPIIYVTATEGETSALRADYPHLLVLERRDGWLPALILLAGEILRRIEVLGRAHRAERVAVESQRYAVLGRYMLDMRPNVNDALTSVLGNADLLLLEPGQAVDKAREQIKTIHRMSIRLNEIMQRFSSLACEMQAADEEFRPEADAASRGVSTNSQVVG